MKLEFPEKFNMSDYFLYHNLEEGRENKTCLYYKDETQTYAEVARMSNSAGHALREFGAHMEDRVLIVLPDCPEFVWTWFGANRIGAVITMVNPLLPAEDYRYYLDYTRARVAVIHESLLETFAEASRGAKYLRNVLVVGDEYGQFVPFKQAVLAQPDELTPADTHRDDIAIWLFTSGSTGHPKGAVHLQHDLPFNTEVFARRTMGVNENDLTVSVPKLFFGYATGTNLLFPFAVGGATALFSERSTPEKMFEVIERYRPTILTTVPTMINGMLNMEGAEGRDLSSLRFCYSAGEALPVELYTRWMERFGIEICDGIGSAEMFHIYITNRPGDVKPGSLGRIVEGYEAKIVDTEGREVPTGEMGTRGRDRKGSRVTEKARIVIGADGARSIVASTVQAPVYLDKGMLTCNYYAYWSGVPLDGAELYPRDGRLIVADKTNDGLVMVTVVWPKEAFNRVRSNIEAEFMRSLDEHAPGLAERVRAGRREERFAGTGFLPNHFRKPYGAGWALVGDAGYVKDPATAQGITNSFSHAELLAEALDDGFSGKREMCDALADYERRRNDEVILMFEHTCQLASLAPPPPEMIRLLEALRGNYDETGRFLGTVTGTMPIQEFFSQENVSRIVKASALRPAA